MHWLVYYYIILCYPTGVQTDERRTGGEHTCGRKFGSGCFSRRSSGVSTADQCECRQRSFNRGWLRCILIESIFVESKCFV